MSPIVSAIKNEYQQQPLLFPIMGQWETRFNELCLTTFNFKIPHPHKPRVDNGLIVLVVRAPPGYSILLKWFSVSSAEGCKKNPLKPDDPCGLAQIPTSLARGFKNRIEIALPGLAVMKANFDYSVELSVHTPKSIY